MKGKSVVSNIVIGVVILVGLAYIALTDGQQSLWKVLILALLVYIASLIRNKSKKKSDKTTDSQSGRED